MKKLLFTTILSLTFSLSYTQGVYRDAFSNDASSASADYWFGGNSNGYAVTHQTGSGAVTITKGAGGYPFAEVIYLPYDNPEMSGGGNIISSIDMSNDNDTIFIIAKSNINGTLLRITIGRENGHSATNYTSSTGQDILVNQHALTTSYTLIKYPFKVVKDFFNSGCLPESPCPIDKSAITQFLFSINPEDPNAIASVDIDYFQVGGSAPACPGGSGSLPTADAGPDVTVCPETPLATFNGASTNASYTYWNSIDNGTFSAPGSLSTTYNTDGEYFNIAAMVLDVYSANGCSASDVALYIINTQSAYAGEDQSLLCGTASVSLNGSVTGAPIGTWSGGTGTFNPDATTLNASYTPSLAEITAGDVTLTLTSSGSTCNAVSNSMTITIAPAVDAGGNQTLACGNSSVTLQGNIDGAPGGIWTGGTGTFTPNDTDLNATYTPSSSEIIAGVAILTLTSTGSDCPQTDDQLIIPISSCATGIISSIEERNVLFNTFPNPSNGTFTLQLNTEENYHDMKVEIINAVGEITLSKNIQSSSIDISGLPKGLYTIKLFQNDGLYQFKKIIIE